MSTVGSGAEGRRSAIDMQSSDVATSALLHRLNADRRVDKPASLSVAVLLCTPLQKTYIASRYVIQWVAIVVAAGILICHSFRRKGLNAEGPAQAASAASKVESRQ